MRLSRYFLVKQPTYDTNAVVSKTSPGNVFSCSLKFATDSAQRTFSEAKPPTNRLASSIVIAVCSASCWHFNFSAVALKKLHHFLTLVLIKCSWVMIQSHKVKICLFEICTRCWKTLLYSKETDNTSRLINCTVNIPWWRKPEVRGVQSTLEWTRRLVNLQWTTTSLEMTTGWQSRMRTLFS